MPLFSIKLLPYLHFFAFPLHDFLVCQTMSNCSRFLLNYSQETFFIGLVFFCLLILIDVFTRQPCRLHAPDDQVGQEYRNHDNDDKDYWWNFWWLLIRQQHVLKPLHFSHRIKALLGLSTNYNLCFMKFDLTNSPLDGGPQHLIHVRLWLFHLRWRVLKFINN